MSKPVRLCRALLVAGIPLASPFALASNADHAAVRQAIEARHAEFARAEVSRDVSAMLESWTDDVTLVPPGKEPLRSKQKVADWLAPLPKSRYVVEAERFETTDLVVQGDIAIEVGHVIGSGHLKGQPSEPYRTNYLSVWRRQKDGTWRMSHDMWDFIETPAESKKE